MGLTTDINALRDPCDAGAALCVDPEVLDALLHTIVDGCVSGLLNCDNALPSAMPPVSLGASFIGTLGFVGPMMRGALLFEIPVAAACLRAGVDDDDCVRDWVGEMTNQLLGRIKNRLLGHGLDISLSTPIVITGRALGVRPGRCSRVTRNYSEPGNLRVVFEYASTPCFAFAVDFADAAIEEGTALFF